MVAGQPGEEGLMRVRSLFAALAALVAFALVICPGVAPAAGPAQARYEPRFESAPCPDLPEPVALPTARCGFLVVPENRSRPEGRTIRLAVAIVPAVSPQPAADPIVHLTGGPGGNGKLRGAAVGGGGVQPEPSLDPEEPAGDVPPRAGAYLRGHRQVQPPAGGAALGRALDATQTRGGHPQVPPAARGQGHRDRRLQHDRERRRLRRPAARARLRPDRKSTRLNSSHANISYAVFCL